MKTPEQRVLEYIQKTGQTNPNPIRCAMNRAGPMIPMDTIRAALAKAEKDGMVPLPTQQEQKDAVRGINLSNVRVFDRKPNEGLKAKFYKLQKGKGFPLELLSNEWGVTEDTIKNQAKRLDCLKYVEVNPGDWIACILHPDTATEYKQ